MYSYEMVSAATGKDVIGRILCLGGLERAFLEKGEETPKQTKKCFQDCVCLRVCMNISSTGPLIGQNGLR